MLSKIDVIILILSPELSEFYTYILVFSDNLELQFELMMSRAGPAVNPGIRVRCDPATAGSAVNSGSPSLNHSTDISEQRSAETGVTKVWRSTGRIGTKEKVQKNN